MTPIITKQNAKSASYVTMRITPSLRDGENNRRPCGRTMHILPHSTGFYKRLRKKLVRRRTGAAQGCPERVSPRERRGGAVFADKGKSPPMAGTLYYMPRYIAMYCLALRRQLKSHLRARGTISER